MQLEGVDLIYESVLSARILKISIQNFKGFRNV